jgi:hypothetical protein
MASDLVEGYEPSDADWAFMLDEEERFEALSPEQQADELNRCTDLMGSGYHYKAARGRVIPEHWRMVVRVRPLVAVCLRTRSRPRSSRARRLVRLRCSSSASRDGPGESDDGLDPPGDAGLVGVGAA